MARSRNHFCRGIAVSIKYSCFSYQACKLHTPITLSSVASRVIPQFFTLSHKRHDFRKKTVEHKIVCFDILCTICPKTYLILRKIQRDIIIRVHRSLSIGSIIPVIF